MFDGISFNQSTTKPGISSTGIGQIRKSVGNQQQKQESLTVVELVERQAAATPDAIALRTWDDAGKVEGLDVGALRDWEPLVRSLAEIR